MEDKIVKLGIKSIFGVECKGQLRSNLTFGSPLWCAFELSVPCHKFARCLIQVFPRERPCHLDYLTQMWVVNKISQVKEENTLKEGESNESSNKCCFAI